jgi:class 3 adenylate cyclase/tetratricopeptide (TPR) repeat protein
MIGVGDWLDSLGLGQYRDLFASNDVSLEILKYLSHTDSDLLTLSVVQRNKLLEAFKAGRPISDPRSRTFQEKVERRNLTVMFCDLVGSTELSMRLDPEDLRRIILRYQDRVAVVVECFGGFVARYMGDGILAYFGWPRAGEDDAAHAVAAALGIVEAVHAVATEPQPLQARIGIATGLAIVGDLIGRGASREETVIGHVPNLAARLQALAPPETVLIAKGTRQLIGQGFDLEPFGCVHLKGFDEALPVWRVKGENRFASRFATRIAGPAVQSADALIGREAELALLHSRWRRVLSGHGEVVLLRGEAGIGKSRTAAAFTAQIRNTEHRAVVYQCLPQNTSDPLHPVARQIEFAAGFAPTDPAERRLEKLDALLAGLGDNAAETVSVFADLLSLPASARDPPRDLDPTRRKARTLAVLLESLSRLARAAPLVVLLEDAQWIDPTSLELLKQLVARFDSWQLMLLVTARPEFKPFWGEQTNTTICDLARLGRSDTGAIIRAVAGGKSLPIKVFKQIQTRTDGVPLFVEELTKMVLESGRLMESSDGWVGRGPGWLNIPATLQDSLMARLDRLDWVKELAQIAAAIGRDFSRAVIAPISGWSPDQLDDGLERLLKSELVLLRSATVYSFKHVLVREAAYESMLHSDRRELNRRIAIVLATQFPDVAETQPETIAHYLSEAQLHELAIQWWRRAGQRNIHASANIEAIAHLERCLALVNKLPAGRRRDLIELDIRTDLGVPLMGTKGYTAPMFRENVDHALELCERVGEHERLFPALWGQLARTFSAGEVLVAFGMAKRFLESAERHNNRQLRMIGHRLCGMTLFGRGELTAAREHLERALKLYDSTDDPPLRDLYGFDQRVAALSYLGRTLQQLGLPDQARLMTERAVTEARVFDHVNTTLYVQGCILELSIMRRERAAIAEAANQLGGLAAGRAESYELVSLTCNRVLALMRGESTAAAVAGIHT